MIWRRNRGFCDRIPNYLQLLRGSLKRYEGNWFGRGVGTVVLAYSPGIGVDMGCGGR